MPESIGGAVFEIWTDDVKLERGIQSAREKAKQLSGDFGRLGKKIESSLKRAHFERLGKQLTSVGKKLTLGLTAPITAFAALTIKTFGDFDQAMTESTAIMGKLSDEMKNRMTDAAKEIAKQTTFSATEAAESFFFLASAGLSAEQSIAALPRVAKFAQAGAFDMARATDLLTDAQSALGLTVEDTAQNMENMNRVSDVLVKANTLANAKVHEFSEALTNRAGVALRSLNKDLEEGVAVLGVFADQGIKGQRAGEQLSIVLRDLQTASLDNKEAFQAANVAVFDQAEKMRNLADITDDLTRRLAPMTDEQKKAELAMLGFQDRSQAAILQLVGLGGQIRKYEEELRNAGGITEEVSEKQLEGLNAKLKQLWNAITNLQISIGEAGLLDFVADLVKSLTGFISRLSELNPAILKWGTVIAGVAAAIGPVLIALGAMLPAITAITGAIAGAGGLVAVLTAGGGVLIGPVGWIAAIGAATYALGSFLDKFEWWRRETLRTKQGAEKLNEELLELGIVVERGELRIDHWADKLIEAAQKAGILGEDFRRLSTDVESTGAASTESKNQFEELMAKISESSQKFVDFSKTARDANIPVNALTKSQEELADRLKDLQALPKEVAEQIAFLERAGFSAEQQFALLSGRLDELVRASELVKLQIPDSAQELIEFGEAAQASQKQFHKSMDKIGESIKGQAGEMGKLIKNTDSWGKSVTGLEKKLKEKLKTLAKLEKDAAKIFKATGQNIQGFQQWGKGTSELRERIERLSETLNAGRERMTALKERAEALKVSIEADERAFLDLQERIRKVTGKELKGFQKAADKVKDSIDKKKGALVRVQGEYDNLADVVEASEGQLEHLNETLDDHKNNLGDVGEAAKGMAKDHQEAIDEAAREAERLTRVWEETMGNVVASISENLTDALFEAKNFADGMKKTFKEMAKGLVQLLIAELFSPLRDLMLGLGQSIRKWLFGGQGGLTGGAVGGGSGFGSLTGGISSIITSLTAALGPVGAIISGIIAVIGLVIKFGGEIADFAANLPTAIKVIFPVLGLIDIFHNTPIEAGSKESVRDFGVGVSERSIKNFLPSVGLSEKQFEPIRKDILSSPKFLEDMLIPAAKAQGKLEELIASFSRLETSWGTFDLSGPLREAIESGNFEAYNDAWEEVFKKSDRLVNQFGPDFIQTLGGTEMALEEAGQATDRYSEELKNLAAASGVGVEHLDVFSAAMDSQKGIVGGLQEGMAGFLGTVVGFGETLRAETDLTDDQIQRLGWEMFGDQARELAAGFELLGLEIPPLMQQILDFGDAIGVASENMDTFGTAYLSGASTLGALQERTAALSGEISGLTSLLLQSMDAAQANEVIWALFGDNITQVAQEFIILGQEVPSFIQDMLDVGASINAVSDEFIRMADAADIAKDQWDAFARGREKGAQTAKGVSDRAAFLVGDIEAWTNKNLSRFGDDIEAAQKLGWDVFGRQAQAIVTQLDAYRLDVPGLLRMVVDWGQDRGLLEGQDIPRPNLPTPPRTSLSRSFGGSSRSVSSGSSSLASLSASGLLPIQKAAEQLAQGQAEQVVPLLRSINQGINPDEGVETRFLPRRTVVRREEVAEIVKDILLLDEGGVREVIREIQ